MTASVEIMAAHQGSGERVDAIDHILIKIIDRNVGVFVLQKKAHGHIIDIFLPGRLEEEHLGSDQPMKADRQLVVVVVQGSARSSPSVTPFEIGVSIVHIPPGPEIDLEPAGKGKVRFEGQG
jgi:hypothetical protein